jgi:cytoskeletal protein CcmA (bactofilin family)
MGKDDIKSSELEAFLGKDTSFEGKMIFEGVARLDGKFQGEIFSGDVLIIGETAAINAKVKVGTLIVDGEVSGDVSAASKIEIHSTGKLKGNITAPALVIREGGFFEGSCKMEKGEGMGTEKEGKKVVDLREDV